MKNIFYIINEMGEGGAEIGLLNLINEGFFEGTNLSVVCLGKVQTGVEAKLTKLTNVVFLSENKISSKRLPLLFFKLYLKLIVLGLNKNSIVIASLPQANLLARLLKIFRNFYLISFEHNTQYRREIANKLIKYSDFLTDHFFCDSKSTEVYLINRLSKKAKPINCLPLCYFDINVKERIIKKDTVINFISVGRLVKNKSHDLLIYSIFNLNRAGVNAVLNVYGDGPEKNSLKNLSKILGIEDKVIFNGFVDDWKENCKDAHFFCLASKYEGLSLATLEAMSIGLVPIVTPVGELNKYIINNHNGIFFENDFSIKAIDIITDENLFKFISNNAQEYILKNYSHSIKEKIFKDIKMGLGI